MRPAAQPDRSGRRPRKADARGPRATPARRGRDAPVVAPLPAPKGDEASVQAVAQDVLAILAAFGLED